MKSCIPILFLILLSLSILPAQVNFTQADSNQIDRILSEYTIDQTPGIAVSVMSYGKEVYQAQKGYANLEHMVPINDETRLLVGSISKQFTCFAILLLEQDGLLSIDSTVAQYLPELQDLKQSITLRQLMIHTSGYRNTWDLTSLKGRDAYDHITFEEVVELILSQRNTNYPPGDRFLYCNSSYILLAEIVGRVSGQSFSTFVQERILKPLEMTNSQFDQDNCTVIKNKAMSYQKVGNDYRYIPMNSPFVGSTGLWTTTSDLGRWASNFHEMKVGDSLIMAKMRTRGRLNDGRQLPYALGQEIKIYKGLEVVFHGGGDAGFRSYLVRVPKHQLSIAVSGNFEAFNPLNIAYGLLDIALAEHLENIQKDIPSYRTADLEHYTGTYQIFPGLYVNILAENDTLYIQGYGTTDKGPLPVQGPDEFNFPYQPHSKIKFFQDSLNWHLSDFYYPGRKVNLNPPTLDHTQLSTYTGLYYSSEIDTYYEILLREGQLIAKHINNGEILLTPIAEDAFIAQPAYASRFEFTKDGDGQVVSCKISGQAAWDVVFDRR